MKIKHEESNTNYMIMNNLHHHIYEDVERQSIKYVDGYLRSWISKRLWREVDLQFGQSYHVIANEIGNSIDENR